MFAAFLSYRHREPDRLIARGIQTWLESQTVPFWLVRRGLGRNVGKVFLDEYELQAGSITAAIRKALLDSRLLIVVCSRETPSSIWVDDEVKTFIAHGSASRILLLHWETPLTDCLPRRLHHGSGDDSHPSLVAPDDVFQLPLDPTGAPTMTETIRMRLLARLLGCDAHELDAAFQFRRRLRRSAAALAFTSAAAATAAGVIGLNTQVEWISETTSESRGGACMPPLAIPLGNDRMLTCRLQSGPDVLNMRTVPPTVLRHFVSPNGGPWKQFGPVLAQRSRFLALAQDDSGAHVVDLETGAVTQTPIEEGETDFSAPDVLWSVAPSAPDTVRLYAIADGKELGRIEVPYFDKPIATEDFFPDAFAQHWKRELGYLIAEDRRTVIGPLLRGRTVSAATWSVATGDLVKEMRTRLDGTVWVSFAVDRTHDRVATLEVQADHAVVGLWVASTGKLLRSHRLESMQWQEIAFSPGGTLVLITGARFASFDARDLEPRTETASDAWTMLYPSYAARSLFPLRRYRIRPRLMTSDGSRIVLRTLSGDERRTIDTGAFDHETMLTTDHRSRSLLTVRGETAAVSDLRNGRRVTLQAWNPGSAALRFSHEGHALAASLPTGTLRIYDASTGDVLTEVAADDRQSTLSYSSRCRRLTIQYDPVTVELREGHRVLRHFFVPTADCGRSSD